MLWIRANVCYYRHKFIFSREESGPGEFQSSKAITMGVPKQKLGELIKNGNIDTGERIIQVNECLGSVLLVDKALGPSIPGRKVVILGDTCNSDNIIEVKNFQRTKKLKFNFPRMQKIAMY